MLNYIETPKNIIDQVSKIVEVTLGPNGKYIVLSNGKEAAPTKDGVSCVRSLTTNDPYEKGVLLVIQEAVKKTLEQAGDGTTSTIIFANKMFESLNNGLSEESLTKKVKAMVEGIKDIREKVKTKEDIKKLALTSVAGDEKLAEAVTTAFELSANNGTNIVVETGVGDSIDVYKFKGVAFNTKIAKDGFGHEIKFDNTIVVPYAGTMESEVELIGFLNNLSKVTDKANIVFIATGYTEEVMSTILVNHLTGDFKMIPLLVSGAGVMDNVEVVKVLGATVNANIYGPDVSILLDDISVDELVEQNNDLLFSLSGKKAIFKNIDDKPIDDEFVNKYKEKLQKAKTDEEANMFRYILSLLSRESVVIDIKTRLNAKTIEVKDRLDDAIGTITTALKYGMVQGGGKAYKILSEKYGPIEEHFYKLFSYIYDRLFKTTNSDKYKPYDSAYTIEVVLNNALELAKIINKSQYVIAALPPKK